MAATMVLPLPHRLQQALHRLGGCKIAQHFLHCATLRLSKAKGSRSTKLPQQRPSRAGRRRAACLCR